MDSCECTSLLPENATDLELAVERVMHQKYCDADEWIIKKLSDPWECPAEFLPWLAYAESVDVWNDRWPELTKRSVIANARQIHKHKGTIGGVRDALDALGVRMESVSWQDMQPEGEVGTISFELWINENFNPDAAVMLDAQMITDITQTIRRNKRLSVHYTLTLGIEVQSPFGTATSLQVATQMLMNAENTETRINAGTLNCGLAVSAHAATHTAINSLPTSTAITAGQLGMSFAVTGQLTTIMIINMKDAA